jgi:hypothetical protein
VLIGISNRRLVICRSCRRAICGGTVRAAFRSWFFRSILRGGMILVLGFSLHVGQDYPERLTR